MKNRRTFLQAALSAGGAIFTMPRLLSAATERSSQPHKSKSGLDKNYPLPFLS